MAVSLSYRPVCPAPTRLRRLEMASVWEVLSKVDCKEHIEQKGQFSYLAWTWAWAIMKARYPYSIRSSLTNYGFVYLPIDSDNYILVPETEDNEKIKVTANKLHSRLIEINEIIDSTKKQEI